MAEANVMLVTFDYIGQGNASAGQLTSSVTSPTILEGCRVQVTNGLLSWENPLNVISAQTEQLVDSIKAAIVVPIVFIAGCPANCVNMAVFYKMGLKERINTCLFILSLVNFLYLSFVFVLYGERSFALSAPRYGPVYNFVIENHIFGLYGIVWATGFVSIIITSERCFCIYFPLRSQTLMRTKTMAMFLTLSCLVITFGFFVISEKYSMVCRYDAQRNITFFQLSKSTSYYTRYQHFIDVFDGTVYGILLPAVFCVIDVGCCTAMVVKIRKTLSWRNITSSAVPHKEILLTKMLICLSIQHNVISAPNLCFRAASTFVSDLKNSGKHFNTFSLMFSVSEIFAYLNSCLPFFVYYFVGSKYRQTLHKMLKITKDGSFRCNLPSRKCIDDNPFSSPK